jgi:hypothetical protein
MLSDEDDLTVVGECEGRVVVFTGEGSGVRPDVEAAGAHALLPKTACADALLTCLRTVVVGCGCCPHCL